MKFRRNLLSRLYRNSDPDADGGGGGFAETTAPQQPAVTEATQAPVAETPSEPTKPGSMLEAMFGQKPAAVPTAEEAAEAAKTGQTVQQLRDQRGRFAGKAPADPNAPPPEPKQPPKPGEKPEHQMPDGLQPEAQKRFQHLANTNKELSARVQEWEPIVQSALGLQQTFQQHGITREQFDQATNLIGLMNRGDLRGALSVLDQQRKALSLAMGVPVAGTDALSDFPDLRQAVDNLQITEQHAMELARGRVQQLQARQSQQSQQREQQSQHQAQQVWQQGQVAVDKFCREQMANDLDYAKIEPLLLEQIKGGLLQGIPPSQWASLVAKTYSLIKQTASQVRTTVPTSGTPVLRPTGGESPRQAPKTMYEAMFGGKP